MARGSEPHKITEPVTYANCARALCEDGLIHLAWMFFVDKGGTDRLRMACGAESLRWVLHPMPPMPAPTCVWCIVGYLPWLHWKVFDGR